MPGSNARAMEKAATLPADAVILDLEDAVAPEAKEAARAQVCAMVKARPFGKREVIIRVNGLDTPWGHDDIEQAGLAAPDAILVPKVGGAADVDHANQHLGAAPKSVALWIMMETPQAIFHAEEIAGAGGRLACFVMGTNDLVKEMRGQHTPAREGLIAALSLCVLAAVCAQGRAIGFDGKTLIHPSQIEACNRAFSPATDDVARARAILAAFARPENSGKGAISLDGRMVELLHAEIAKETVALDDAIRALATP